jgi:hypothetical protein
VKGYVKYPMLILIFNVIHWIWARHLTCVFCFFSVFATMAQKVTNDWKDQGWWIMAEAAQTPMLWITTYAVVEGRRWERCSGKFLVSPLQELIL